VGLRPARARGAAPWFSAERALRRGAPARTAFRAALWYNATLTVCVGGMLATPDSPASLFWTVALWCLAHYWEKGRATWWLAAGAAAGLAVLSKYSGLFLAPGVLLWLWLIPGGRAELRRPGPWEGALLAIFVFAPNVVWNSDHHWITFIKQFGRVAPHGAAPVHIAEFLAAQFLLLTPLIAIYAFQGVRLGWRERAKSGAVHLMLPIATSAPFAVYMLIHAVHARVQGHWPVPLFGALAICAAVAAERSERTRLGRIAARLTPAIGLGLGAAILVLMAAPGPPLLGGADPSLALRGWPRFSRDVEALRVATGAAWVGTQSYGEFAQLALAGGVAAPLLQLIERDRYWSDDTPRPDFTRPGLVVDISRRLRRADVLRCFTSVSPAGELGRAGGIGGNQRYTAFLVSGPRHDVWLQGCPAEISPGVWR
uniref:ArnT family glycosyltransferase n=1 Tax=Phenylobacterium sp. TaxID=1871053 RepID=UPI00286C6690